MLCSKEFYSTFIETPLGPMIAIADDVSLYLLEFADKKSLEHGNIVKGTPPPIISIKCELKSYFDKTLQNFQTPICMVGSDFQKKAWEELRRTPYGETRSYLNQATNLGKPTAFRAVANANGANKLAVIIPCHRIIRSNGALGGYAGGIEKKEWLIRHENLYE